MSVFTSFVYEWMKYIIACRLITLYLQCYDTDKKKTVATKDVTSQSIQMCFLYIF